MDNISDIKRDQIKKTSIIAKLVHAFPETTNEFENALHQFQNIHLNSIEDSNYINQEEKELRLEFADFLKKANNDIE